MTKILKIACICLAVIGVGLLLWASIGQVIAQVNYDGQYIAWRTVSDVSLWGCIGAVPIVIAMFVFLIL